MKKLLSLLSIVMALSMMLSACSGQAAPAPSGDNEQQPATSAEKTNITIFVGFGSGTDPDQITAQEALAQKFNESHDTIEIEFLFVPWEEAPERYLAMEAGGNPPDLVGPVGVANIATYFDSWEDIQPYIERDNYDLSDFYDPTVELQQYSDKMVGLPIGVYPSFILYNKDAFDAAGLPEPTHNYADKTWTMDALREAAMKLTLDKNGNTTDSPNFDPENIVQWGFDDSWTDMRGLLTKWDAPGKGRPTTDDFKTATANSKEWVYGLQWMIDGMWKDYFIPSRSGLEAIDATGLDPFTSKLVAMFYAHTWFMSEGFTDLTFEYDLAPLPYNQKGTRLARIHSDVFAMPKNSKNKDAAWEVMKWLAAEEQLSELCKIYGCIPARESLRDEFTKSFEEKYGDVDVNVVFGAIDYLDAPSHESWVPEWSRVADALNTAYEAVPTGDNKDAQAILDAANLEVQKILDEYWSNKK